MPPAVGAMNDRMDPMRQRFVIEFPYKHSTGGVVGRFLAGLKDQKKIWGRRARGLGVVVPPFEYSEADASPSGDWVEVGETGVVTACAIVSEPVARLHPFDQPFAFALIRLDGADTSMCHVIKDDLDRLAVGSRVRAVWAPDGERVGSIRDIRHFELLSA